MAERLYTFQEFRKDISEDAKNRHLQILTELRTVQKQELIVHGTVLPGERPKEGRQLVEILLNATIATAEFKQVVGFLDYRVVPSNGGWEARLYAALTNGKEEGPLRCVLLEREEDAWMECGLMYELDRRMGILAHSYSTIQEVPSRCARFTEDDFIHQELARINFERLRQPELFALCLELGLGAVLEPADDRLRIAMMQDRIWMTGKWPNQLPQRFHHLIEDLVRVWRRSKLQVSHEVRQRLDIYAHLAKFWNTAGYSVMHQKDLTDFVNAKFGTNFSMESLARQCQRLGLHSKRLKKRPELKLSGPDVDARLEDLEHPPLDLATASFF